MTYSTEMLKKEKKKRRDEVHIYDENGQKLILSPVVLMTYPSDPWICEKGHGLG